MIAAMNYTKLFILLLCVSFCTSSFGQNDYQQKLDSFSGKFITAIRTHEKQRVYLVTDKSVFINGESIWFKAFLLNSISQRINTSSKFLFVDLVNEKDSVIKVVILDAYNKLLNSRIILPESIPTGYYWLRAYTRQMAESDVNSICVKPIYIVNKIDENNFSKSIKKSGGQDTLPTINFYPEGGTIITGINSAISIQASHLDGMPLSIDGEVKDEHGVAVAHFKTNNAGFGKVDFEPSGYRKYNAIINWHGKEISYTLPSPNFYKGQVSVAKQSGGYKLRILLGDSIYRKDFNTYLVGISKDSLIFASIGKGQYELTVTDQQLPNGIATFYLLDENFKLLSERSIYVPQNNVRINAETDKNIYNKRDKVSLNISITDAKQQPVPSLIAISVADTILANQNEGCTLPPIGGGKQPIDNMFLSSVENNKCLTENDIDLLMIARNDNYQELSKVLIQPTTIDTDSLLYIKGTVLDSKNEPSTNKILTLLSNSGGLIVHTDTTDNNGHFRFPLDNYSDSMQFALEVRDFKGRQQNNKIEFNDPDYPKLKTPASLKEFLPIQTKVVKKYLNSYYESALSDEEKHLLPRVTVKNEGTYDQSKRVSPTSVILTSKELNERNSVGNAVLNVGGMHVINGFLVVNGLTAMKAPDISSEPMLLVNGTQVTVSAGVGESSPVMSFLNELNPKNIDFIEILKGPEGANYGVRGGNGVILVNMSNSTRDGAQNRSNLKTFYAKGISNPVLFPNIDSQQKEITFADNRSTLFWNGSYLIDAANKVTLTFYTSDIPATYKATITGITIHGDIIYKTITFKSK
jgi:hypothetical protein